MRAAQMLAALQQAWLEMEVAVPEQQKRFIMLFLVPQTLSALQQARLAGVVRWCISLQVAS